MSEFDEMTHGERAAGFVVYEQGTDVSVGEIAADDHDGDLVFFHVVEEICLLEDPARNDDHSFGAALEDHAQIVVEEFALRLCIDEERHVAGGLKSGLDSVNDWNAERVGEIVCQHGDGLAATAAK